MAVSATALKLMDPPDIIGPDCARAWPNVSCIRSLTQLSLDCLVCYLIQLVRSYGRVLTVYGRGRSRDGIPRIATSYAFGGKA